MSYEPMVPRITKSTAVAAIKARFNDNGELLERFEVAKEQANLWDGERDGLREAVKSITAGTYVASSSGSTVILTRTETAKVLYPNSAGKHQLENCLQCAIPMPTGIEYDDQIVAFQMDGINQPEEFLDLILHYLQKGKPEALAAGLLPVLVGARPPAGRRARALALVFALRMLERLLPNQTPARPLHAD